VVLDRPSDIDVLERQIAAFESAWAGGSTPNVSDYLPQGLPSIRHRILAELIRVDMEFRQDRGELANLSRYQSRFPELFADRAALSELAFEEYRLRELAGKRPDRHDYERRYGISTADWVTSHEALDDYPQTDVVPVAANTPSRMPVPGERFAEFLIRSELGRGTFGRVFLAEQTDLSNRLVAIKVSTQIGRTEPETLARLQHAHIVPIYATKAIGPFHATIMPYWGATTLADVIDATRGASERPRSASTFLDTIADRHSTTQLNPDRMNPEVSPQPCPTSQAVFARFNFADAVLWIMARLAEALRHTHERGLIHRDIKPANVLLTDEGQPMLLDFNLAYDSAKSSASFGGTPAYMAPEQRDARVGPRVSSLDGRADLYSLAAVAYELLTGKRPPQEGPVPPIRSIHADVTPSADAIIRTCLAPNPADRYPSAAALADDLNRQLRNEPLVTVREPSYRERLRKWSRRHPRLSSTAAMFACSSVLIFGLAAFAYNLSQRADRLERGRMAALEFAKIQSAVPELTERLAFHGSDVTIRTKAATQLNAWRDQFGHPEEPNWDHHPLVASLPASERGALRQVMNELSLLAARAEPDAARALDQYERIIRSYANTGGIPRSVLFERRELASRLGKVGDAFEPGPILDDGRNRYLEGLSHVRNGQFRQARDRFADATAREPTDPWSWLALGNTLLELGDAKSSEGAYQAFIALKPDLPMGYYNRGLARLRLNQSAEAARDFETVLRLTPEYADAIYHYGQAQLSLGRASDAERTFDSLMAIQSSVRAVLARAHAKSQVGNQQGAEADHTLAETIKPVTEVDFITRALSRADRGRSNEALADLDAALRINPRSFPALQNKAFVLDANLKRDRDAIAVLNRAIELYPDSLPARAGRAVLLARAQERSSAHVDAEHCRAIGLTAEATYQMANVYALTSRTHPDDGRIAIRYLADALKQGFGFQHVETDPDLDPIRKLPEFQSLMDAARVIKPIAGQGKGSQ
jgi:serine/threonine protein kinase/TolA-binding protein